MSSTAPKPTIEVLLVGTAANDGHTECIVDARTNIELWSSRGADSGVKSCGGAAMSKLFGREHLITALEKQPLLTIVPLHVRRKNLDRCASDLVSTYSNNCRLTLPQPATDFVVHRDGQILSVACGDKIFTWAVSFSFLLFSLFSAFTALLRATKVNRYNASATDQLH